jgi:hypothetical protein
MALLPPLMSCLKIRKINSPGRKGPEVSFFYRRGAETQRKCNHLSQHLSISAIIS